MQIVYEIYSRDVEMEHTEGILVMKNHSEEDQIFPSNHFKSGFS